MHWRTDREDSRPEKEHDPGRSRAKSWVLLVVGANVLVRGASRLAPSFGISPLVVGLTIVAAGTSMPEVATSLAAVIKGERDIAVGNVVGSSIFDIPGCLGVSGLASGDALQTFSGVMIGFVVPLTVVTLMVVMIRRPTASGGA